MTNAPESRKTHITRIFGTNKNGDRLENIWVDVERMDIVKSAHQVPPTLQWQGLQRQFRWCDDPNADDYQPDGTPSRTLEILKVCDVQNETDPNNPEQWVPIKVAKGVKTRAESGLDYNGGSAMDRFIASVTADEISSTREITVRRVVHYDTNVDDLIQGEAAANADLREYVVSATDYVKDLSSKDTDRYVEHEIIKSLKSRGNTTDVNGQGSQTTLLNQYLIDESEDATQAIVGASGYNPPYRLDPFQNIVNVKFTTLFIVVSISAANQSFSSGPYGPSPDVESPSVSAVVRNKGAKLLDTHTSPDAGSTDGPIQCMVWFNDFSDGSVSAQQAYEDGPFHGYSLTTCIDGVCNTDGVPEEDDTAPIDFQKSITVSEQYLFRVPSGDGAVTVDISGLMETTDTGPNHPSNNQVTTSGFGTIQISVWSTARGKITTIDQLIDIHQDGKQRPSQDDSVSLGVTDSDQGRFTVNIKLDKDKSHVQTDNYGNKFQPYKVTIDPGPGTDQIPPQPPPLLPK